MKTLKYTNKTRVAAISFAQTVQKIVVLAKITNSDRIEVLFDLGCRFVERFVNEGFGKRLLEERGYGFWAFWLVEFLKDDEMLLVRPELFKLYSYRKIKEQMMHDRDVSDSFCFYLNTIIEPRF